MMKMLAHLLLITLVISRASSQGAGDGSVPSEGKRVVKLIRWFKPAVENLVKG